MKSKVLVLIGLVTIAAVLLFGLGFAPKAAQDGTSSGAGVIALHGEGTGAAAARMVNMEELPELAPYKGHYREIPDHPEPGEGGEFEQGGPVAGYQAGEPSPMSVEVETETPGTSTAFQGQGEAACGNWIPSDHALATNSSYVVQVLNSCLVVYNTAGKMLSGYPKNLNGFWNVSDSHIVGDVRCLYDWKSSRFILVAEDFTGNKILLADSFNSNPTGTWWLYSIDATLGGVVPGSADFPMLGQTYQESGDGNGGIYLSWDRFDSSGNFHDNVIMILPKSKIYAGSSYAYQYWYGLTANGNLVDHVQPAAVMSRADRPQAEFLVNTFDFNRSGCASNGTSCNGLVLWAISNGVPPKGQGSTLSLAVIKTAHNYVYPVSAAQPGSPSGSTCAINTSNNGVGSTVYWSAGDLYLAASTGSLNGQKSDGWIYWQVHPYLTQNSKGVPVLASTAATIRDEVCWGCSGFTGDKTYSEYYPSVQPDDEGNITVVFNESSSTRYPLTAYLSKRTTQTNGSFPDGGWNLAGGLASYCQLDTYGRNRWGDYTATAPVGTQNATTPTFWFAGQYSDSKGNWATEIGKNAYTSMNQN